MKQPWELLAAGTVPVEYLSDESRMSGAADAIAFPTDIEEVSGLVRYAFERGQPVTVQGARTGLSGGAVPMSGLVLNLSRMDRIDGMEYDGATDRFFLSAQPGAVLKDLNAALAAKRFDTAGWMPEAVRALEMLRGRGAYIFPPDPTETLASVGGMISCNASGACSFHYGSTRFYVEALDVVLADGEVLRLRRGEKHFDGGKLKLRLFGAEEEIILPRAQYRDIKNVAMPYVRPDMDLIDLFVGAEGSLGIVAGALLRLVPASKEKWGLVSFFRDEAGAFDWCEWLRKNRAAFPGVDLLAVEYIDGTALRMIDAERETDGSLRAIPEVASDVMAAVYLEMSGESEEEMEDALAELTGHMEAFGADSDEGWLASAPKELERLNFFRHAVPESANRVMDRFRLEEPMLTTICTDLSVPEGRLAEMVARYREDTRREGIGYSLYGHIGDNHLHVNLLPRNSAQYDAGMRLYREWAALAVSLGGTVSAEHGIGKQKAGMLEMMADRDDLRAMRHMKNRFDPRHILNPGTRITGE